MEIKNFKSCDRSNEKVVNVNLSRELKREYRHRAGNCYNNAWEVAYKHKAAFVVGLTNIETKDGLKLMRHAWNVIENEIVDTSLARVKETFENKEYYPIFTLKTAEEKLNAMYKTTTKGILEYNPTYEKEKINEITEKTGLKYLDVDFNC